MGTEKESKLGNVLCAIKYYILRFHGNRERKQA